MIPFEIGLHHKKSKIPEPPYFLKLNLITNITQKMFFIGFKFC